MKQYISILQSEQPSTSGGLMVSKLDQQTFKSEFESHWVLYLFDLIPHWSKNIFEASLLLIT